MLQTKIIEYQKIQELIDQFDSEKLKENAYFGIFDEEEYSYIKANKEGLLLYSMYLLIAAENIDNLPDGNKEIIPFETSERWIDEESLTIIQYIEKFTGKRKVERENNNNSASNKLFSIGCFLLFIIFGVAFFVGLGEIIKWF